MDTASPIMKSFYWIAVFICISLGNPLSAEPPKLILQITVDQLRGDLPYRFIDRFSEGGFRYFLENGIAYRDAHHTHANTETIVGHATLATGATPSIHGMVANVWYDYEKERLVYNIEDERYPLLSADADVSKKTEIDPTQKKAKVSGRSPANILVSTFSDELSLMTNGQAKVFGVSVKDRGAVAMAGHTGKAYWFSKKSGDFVTSRYYYDQYPEWVARWNNRNHEQEFANQSWDLLYAKQSYLYSEQDDSEWEVDFPGYGRSFPHNYGSGDSKYFNTLLTLSPAGDHLTLEFAKALIENEAIGEDSITDYLSVSFSSTDYVGHFFGPSSLEMEDNLLRLDQTLASLLAFVDERIGLRNTLVVLSGDHGGAETPGYLTQLGIEAHYVKPVEWAKEAAFAALEKRFGIGEELIQSFFQPYLYLNNGLIEDRNLDRNEVETAIAEEISKFKGVRLALTSQQIANGEMPDTWLTRSVLNNHNPKRSGNLYIVFDPHHFINDMDGLEVAVHHGSPWSYDTFVPVIFAGGFLEAKSIYRRIDTVDIAPTLSAFIKTKPPSGATGKILEEVFE